jgi:hypothetical protein
VIEVDASTLPHLFKKRPVVVMARRFTNPNDIDLAAWCDGELIRNIDEDGQTTHAQIDIATLEGVMSALVGDWIIRGVQGEFYPCRNDIFQATYEQVVAQ